jgi:hypothetical protein
MKYAVSPPNGMIGRPCVDPFATVIQAYLAKHLPLGVDFREDRLNSGW